MSDLHDTNLNCIWNITGTYLIIQGFQIQIYQFEYYIQMFLKKTVLGSSNRFLYIEERTKKISVILKIYEL